MRISERQRSQEDRVDETEYRRRRADPQGEQEDRRECKLRSLAKDADGLPRILPE